ncbi:hypothetical protein GGI07_003668 [Coemansia sp. Benny D115]|nr:hypothetical protein GGI07_003668 [Coemansia sp. Benny D115]
MSFDMELQIPKAYGKIQYDIKHGSVTVSHSIVQQDDSSESSSRNTSEDSLDVLTETATEGSGGSGSSQLSGISPVGADANVGLAETWSWEMVQEQSRGGFMPLEERMQVSARQ